MSELGLLSVADAAQILGVSIQTLRRWDEAGYLRADFRSPGGHRKYKRETLEAFSVDLTVLAERWVLSELPEEIKPALHCDNSGIFQVRLHRLEGELVENLKDVNYAALVTAVVGEIGNNSFDHNYGNWPDVSGIFFGVNLSKRMIVLADRGQGILASLKRVRPSLENAEQALAVAFTEIISGRAPEPRGNGLKFVYGIVRETAIGLHFRSGDAQVDLSKQSPPLAIVRTEQNVRGTLAVITY